MYDFRKEILSKIDLNISLSPDELKKLVIYNGTFCALDNGKINKIVPLLGRYFLIGYIKTNNEVTDITQPVELFPECLDSLVCVRKKQMFTSKDKNISIPLERETYYDALLLLESDYDFSNFIQSLDTGILEE